MRKVRPVVAIVLVAVAALPLAAAPVPGDCVLPFPLPEANGDTLSWTPGRATVLCFCTFWCDTWKEQSRRLDAASKALRGLPVDFLTISADGRWSERSAGRTVGRLLLDRGSALTRSLGIDGIPYTIVVDTQGRVSFAAQGIVRASSVRDAVRNGFTHEPSRPAGEIYLAFDDYPSRRADADDRLLDALRAAGVKATFFCICSQLDENRDVVRRAANEGHSLQVHCWDHTAEDPQIGRCAQALRRAAGVNPTLYQPAGSPKCFRIGGADLRAAVVNPYDYARPGEKELSRRVLLAVRPGRIVLLHAGVSETINALPDIIRSLQTRGFRFGLLQ